MSNITTEIKILQEIYGLETALKELLETTEHHFKMLQKGVKLSKELLETTEQQYKILQKGVEMLKLEQYKIIQREIEKRLSPTEKPKRVVDNYAYLKF